MDQLLAREPLFASNELFTNAIQRNDYAVPLLKWSEILGWTESAMNPKESISVSHDVSPKAFAVIVDDIYCSDEFKKNTFLIFDPQKLARHGDYVILYQESTLFFGQLITHNAQSFLIYNDRKRIVTSNHRFVGILVESKRSFI